MPNNAQPPMHNIITSRHSITILAETNQWLPRCLSSGLGYEPSTCSFANVIMSGFLSNKTVSISTRFARHDDSTRTIYIYINIYIYIRSMWLQRHTMSLDNWSRRREGIMLSNMHCVWWLFRPFSLVGASGRWTQTLCKRSDHDTVWLSLFDVW